MEQNHKLEYFPVSFFSVVMGLAGLMLVARKAEQMFGWSQAPGMVILGIVTVVFLILLGFYLAKAALYFDAVKMEYRHPVKISFFPTISISLLLLSVGFSDVLPQLALVLWILGSLLHLVATIAVLSAWIWQAHFEINHFSPAWFIPVVGNILVPVAGVGLGFVQISWFFFSIGLVFWVVLFTIFLYRIFFHKALPGKLLPTFFILIAPPALAFVSYLKLTGSLDPFAMVLYDFALFMVLFLLVQVKVFARQKFFLSSWAYSFPLAAFSVATYQMWMLTATTFYQWLFVLMGVLLTILIVFLLVKTLQAMAAGKICVKEE